jgi:hypothetical protein
MSMTMPTLSSMVILMDKVTVTTIQGTATRMVTNMNKDIHTLTITSTAMPILMVTATSTKLGFMIRPTPPISIGAQCPTFGAR